MLDTIVALATAPIKSALAVIRVSGETSQEIVSKCFDVDLTLQQTRKINYGHIIDENKTIDEVIVLNYRRPHSFTGENSVEIMCHGSMLIVDEIISLLIKHGARLATKGEFSSRAYLNGKLDLVQAEAINDVINATSKEAKQLSLLSLEGQTSKLIEPLKKALLDLIANIEVNIDYPEYQDVEEVTTEKIIVNGKKIVNQLNKLIAEGKIGEKIIQGIKVAIVGSPNVGKSSLLNALINEDKAIVTSIAGTTRDVVEGETTIQGITFHFYDTAGIHESSDIVEQIGINKAKQVYQSSDIVLLVIDGEKGITKEDEKLIEETKSRNPLLVYNKCENKHYENCINVSAINKNISELKKALWQKVNIQEENFEKPSLNNARQIGLLQKANQCILQAIHEAENNFSLDLISVSLTEALKSLQDILGESADLDIAKEIFSRFCVGK